MPWSVCWGRRGETPALEGGGSDDRSQLLIFSDCLLSTPWPDSAHGVAFAVPACRTHLECRQKRLRSSFVALICPWVWRNLF